MKCPVCNLEYEGSACTRCRFPKVLFPGGSEAGMKAMEPQILRHREKFHAGIELAVIVFRWKDEDGTVAFDRQDRISLGTLKDLSLGETMLPQAFARIPEADTLDLTISIKTDSGERIMPVQVENLKEARLQYLGVELLENYTFRLILANQESRSISETISIF